ncbi:MAG: tetratricopeptide repeat protein, partial [Limisphaerales bacterium]
MRILIRKAAAFFEQSRTSCPTFTYNRAIFYASLQFAVPSQPPFRLVCGDVNFLRQLALLIFLGTAAFAQTNPATRLLQPHLLDIHNDDTSNDSPKTMALRKKALEHYENKDYAAAEKLFAEVLKQTTNDSGAAWRLAYCCYVHDEITAAARAYAQYTTLRPEIPEGHEWLGTCLSLLEKYDEAERELTLAVRLKPDSPDAYDQLGYIYERRTNNAQAAVAFDRAIQFGGETAYRCERSGLANAHTKNYRQAELLLNHTLKFQPTNIFALEWLGFSQFHLHEYAPAITTFNNGLKIAPTNYFFRTWLSYSYLQLKQYDKAADSFAKAARLKPNDLRNQQSQAYALIEAHRAPEAIKVLEPVSNTSSNKTVRLTLLAAYLINHDYKKASELYPVIFTGIAILLGLVYILGSVFLLRKSFRASTAEHPHVAFAIGWLVLYFESQVALMFFAGMFTSANLITGLLLAPIPLIIAAFVAFPKQPWGQPFKPGFVAWKQIGLAFAGWLGIGLVAGAYSAIITSITHSRPEPRNIRFVLDLVHEHRALAAI